MGRFLFIYYKYVTKYCQEEIVTIQYLQRNCPLPGSAKCRQVIVVKNLPNCPAHNHGEWLFSSVQLSWFWTSQQWAGPCTPCWADCVEPSWLWVLYPPMSSGGTPSSGDSTWEPLAMEMPQSIHQSWGNFRTTLSWTWQRLWSYLDARSRTRAIRLC